MKRLWVKILLGILFLAVMMLLAGRLFLPSPLFSVSYSTVLYDRNKTLLGAHIADDGQWRFPASDSIPQKFAVSLIQFEDKYFFKHPGVNPVSLFQALFTNIQAGKVVRGGSTISMQVIRLMRKGQSRTVSEKIKEIFLAIGLELKYSKQEILALYAAHAPFGGNVVGIDAAAWRYYGHDVFEMTWAEAATLAVLPNAPSLVHPGKNRKQLEIKRNKLLDALNTAGVIDSLDCVLAKMEALPGNPLPLPQLAPHLLDYYWLNRPGQNILTSIDARIQKRVNTMVKRHKNTISANNIHNAAVLVINPANKQVLAYVGNTNSTKGENNQNYVDMVRARRSTGSILKPLLYAGMIDDGMILQNSMIPDIPSYFENYHPTNFNEQFEGAVPASMALSRSLNVPAVYMLRDYGTERFLNLLHRVGISSFNKTANHYGLSMILGGGEASLLEITNMYAGMAKVVIDFDKYYGTYQQGNFSPPVIELKTGHNTQVYSADNPLHAGAIWTTYKALFEVQRPESESGWEYYSSSQQIAWKTGTSYGFRDAWAVGTTPEFVTGVWVGNADGEGRTGLVGSRVAAPLMFEVMNWLNSGTSFIPPYDELENILVCRQSGYRASRYCPDVDTLFAYKNGINAKQCTYHQLIFTDKLHHYRLSPECVAVAELYPYSCFVLPPVQEYYYRKSHPSYKGLLPYRADCKPTTDNRNIEFIYPTNDAKVFVSKGVDGELQKVVFEISCRNVDEKVYWHLDNQFIATTQKNHQLAIIPPKGKHKLVVVNENGETAQVSFEVLNE